MWGCEEVEGIMWGCEEVEGVMWGCEEVEGIMWGCEEVEGVMWGCEEVEGIMWGCEEVEGIMWGCEEVEGIMWGCEEVEGIMWGCEEVEGIMWGCEEVEGIMWGCEEVEGIMYLHLLPITDNGAGVLRPGDEVYVISRSQRRGYLVIEHSGDHLHIPHHYTELRVSRCDCGSPKSISSPLSYRSPHLTVLCSPQLRGKTQRAVIYDISTILHTAQSEINEKSMRNQAIIEHSLLFCHLLMYPYVYMYLY